MTPDELSALRHRVDWMRPKMHIELPAEVVRELLDLAELAVKSTCACGARAPMLLCADCAEVYPGARLGAP